MVPHCHYYPPTIDNKACHRCWDISQLGWIDHTDNVINFLISCIQRAPPSVQEFLQCASCVGHTFSTTLIKSLPSRASLAVDLALQISLAQGLVLHVREDIYR